MKEKIYLTWSYGKAQFLIGALYNIMCPQLLASNFFYSIFVDAFIVKALVFAITFYLVRQCRSRDVVFFYINLGLSPRKMQLSVLLIDFLALAILLTTVMLLHA